MPTPRTKTEPGLGVAGPDPVVTVGRATLAALLMFVENTLRLGEVGELVDLTTARLILRDLLSVPPADDALTPKCGIDPVALKASERPGEPED